MNTLENLINDLINPNVQRATYARRMLVVTGTPVVEALMKTLPTASDPHRWKIILILGEIGDASATPSLLPFLDSASPAIRAAVAQFLGNYGDEQVAEILLSKLQEQTTTSATIWMIQALGKLQYRRAVEALIQVVHDADSPSLRYTAIEALGKIGDYRAAEIIRQFSNDSDNHVQTRAQTALQRLSAQQG